MNAEEALASIGHVFGIDPRQDERTTQEADELWCEIQEPSHLARAADDIERAAAIGATGLRDHSVTVDGKSHKIPSTFAAIGWCSTCGEARMVSVTAGRMSGRDKWPACINGTSVRSGAHVPDDRVVCGGRHVPDDSALEAASGRPSRRQLLGPPVPQRGAEKAAPPALAPKKTKGPKKPADPELAFYRSLGGRSPHGARWSPEILRVSDPILRRYALPVHDCYGGTGDRLGQLCDHLGLAFSGTEIEPEYIQDPRVQAGDSTDPSTYPSGDYLLVTSPVYPSGMTDSYRIGDESRRFTYRRFLRDILGHDRELHPNNAGQYGPRRGAQKEARYWQISDQCVAHWPRCAVVNIKNCTVKGQTYPVVGMWRELLENHGYEILEEIPIVTPGVGYQEHADLLPDYEVVLVCEKTASPDEEARDYFTYLWGGQLGWACLCTGSPWRERYLRWPADVEQIVTSAVAQAERHDVYVAVALRSERSRKAATAQSGQVLWADVDDVGHLGRLDVFGEALTLVDSGSGADAYIKLDQLYPMDSIVGWNARLAKLLDDDACFDAARVLRPPGTWWRKQSPPRPVRWQRRGTGTLTGDEVDALLPQLATVVARSRACHEIGELEPDDEIHPLLEAAARADVPRGRDLSGQTFVFVARALAACFLPPEIAAAIVVHRPTMAKWGGDKEAAVADVARCVDRFTTGERQLRPLAPADPLAASGR